MKAVVDGIAVEGTPQEIAEYVKMIKTEQPAFTTPQQPQKMQVPFIPWWEVNKVTCGSGEIVPWKPVIDGCGTGLEI